MKASTLPSFSRARIKPVDCTGCHSDSQYVNFAMSIHANPKTPGKQRLQCADCHRPHAVERLTGADAHAHQKFVMGRARDVTAPSSPRSWPPTMAWR